MANEEHLAILERGIGIWNTWRTKNRDIKPNIEGVDLRGANLSGADLRWVHLKNADIRGANLVDANLCKADLNNTNLSNCDLKDANLSGAYIRQANFENVDLKGANLSEADFTESNLTRAILSKSQALGTNFTAASLTGVCIEEWHINSATNLTDVICDHIYLRQGQQERRPSNGNFAPGEFTKLFQKAQETVDLIFNNGIDWQAFLTSFQKLQVECGGEELSIQAIENKNDGAFVIRVNVPTDANKAEVEKYLKREYELALVALEEKYQLQLQGKDEQIEIYRKQSTDLTEIVKLLAGRATYDLRNSQIGGSLINAEIVNTDEISGNIHNNNA